MTYPKSVVVWDFETTGLNPFANKPIEVAWIVVKDGCVVKERNHFLNYHVDIPEEATSIHGITRAMVEESPDAQAEPHLILSDLVCDIALAGAHVTHNGTNFDIMFLVNSVDRIGRAGLQKDLRATHIDTAAIFKGRGLKIPRVGEESLDTYARRVLRIHSTFKYNLRAACEAHGITPGKQHRALDDVYLTYELYKKMCLKLL